MKILIWIFFAKYLVYFFIYPLIYIYLFHLWIKNRLCMHVYTQPVSADDGHGRNKKAAETPTGRPTRVHADTHSHIHMNTYVLHKGTSASRVRKTEHIHTHICASRKQKKNHPNIPREDISRPAPCLEYVSLAVRVMRPLLGACIHDAFAVRSVSRSEDLR